MTVLWIFIILALSIVAGHYRSRYLRVKKNSIEILEQYSKSYDALERGLDEQVENYENEFLQFQDTIRHQDSAIENMSRHISVLEKENEELKEVAQFHQANCLLDLGEYKLG